MDGLAKPEPPSCTGCLVTWAVIAGLIYLVCAGVVFTFRLIQGAMG